MCVAVVRDIYMSRNQDIALNDHTANYADCARSGHAGSIMDLKSSVRLRATLLGDDLQP